MAMTAAERKRKQRENSYSTATHTVTMSHCAKHQIKKMTKEYGCTVSELIDALASVSSIMWRLMERIRESEESGEEWLSPDAYDPIFMALNWIYELDAEKNMADKEQKEQKPKPLLETYKPEEL